MTSLVWKGSITNKITVILPDPGFVLRGAKVTGQLTVLSDPLAAESLSFSPHFSSCATQQCQHVIITSALTKELVQRREKENLKVMAPGLIKSPSLVREGN